MENADILKLLEDMDCHHLIDGLAGWDFLGTANPYSIEFHQQIASRDDLLSETLRSDFERFRERYEALSDSTKVELKQWAYREFVEPVFSLSPGVVNHPRPKFAWEQVLSKLPRDASILDVGSCHGFHGTLLYRDRYGANFDLHSNDLMPCYNQVLTLCGVSSRYYDADRARLDSVHRGPYDAVLCTEVLEHVRDAAELNILDSIADVLKPDGVVLITFPVNAELDKFNVNKDPLGHIRQPSYEQVNNRLRNVAVTRIETLCSGKADQRVVIGKRR